MESPGCKERHLRRAGRGQAGRHDLARCGAGHPQRHGHPPRRSYRHARSARFRRAGHPGRSGGAPERIRLRLRQTLPGHHPPGGFDRHLRCGREVHPQIGSPGQCDRRSSSKKALKQFVGEIEQTPPPYSAVKVQGRKAYEMARQGEEVELAPRKINVHHLEVLEWAPPEVVIDVHCSSGTYVRSLANDLGNMLGCGAYLVGLRRTKSGRFSLRDATPLRKLQEAFHAGNWYQYLIPAAEALARLARRRTQPRPGGGRQARSPRQGSSGCQAGHGPRGEHGGRTGRPHGTG